MQLDEALEKITQLEKEKGEVQAKLDDNIKNFAEYRKGAEAKEAELNTTLTAKTKEFDDYKGENDKKEGERRTAFRDKLISDKAKGDKDLIAKISAEYNNFNLPDTTDAEISARVDKATAIHLTSKPSIDGANGGGTNGAGAGNGSGGAEVSANAQSFADQLLQG